MGKTRQRGVRKIGCSAPFQKGRHSGLRGGSDADQMGAENWGSGWFLIVRNGASHKRQGHGKTEGWVGGRRRCGRPSNALVGPHHGRGGLAGGRRGRRRGGLPGRQEVRDVIKGGSGAAAGVGRGNTTKRAAAVRCCCCCCLGMLQEKSLAAAAGRQRGTSAAAGRAPGADVPLLGHDAAQQVPALLPGGRRRAARHHAAAAAGRGRSLGRRRGGGGPGSAGKGGGKGERRGGGRQGLQGRAGRRREPAAHHASPPVGPASRMAKVCWLKRRAGRREGAQRGRRGWRLLRAWFKRERTVSASRGACDDTIASSGCRRGAGTLRGRLAFKL